MSSFMVSLLLVVLCTVALLATLQVVDTRDHRQHNGGGGGGHEQVAQPEPSHSVSARQRFQLPSILNFQLYKRLFKRVYQGLEETVRRKLLLARSLRAWISSIKYKFARSSFYLAVNEFSDRSEEELERQANHKLALGDVEMVDLIPPTDEHRRSARNKRHVHLVEDPSKEMPKFASFGARFARVESMRWFRMLESGQTDQLLPGAKQTSGQLNDEVFFDHRQSGCMLEPRSQGECGGCYAFALVAIAEWLYCKQTGGELLAFSEQYLIDCGRPNFMEGCRGGNEYWAGQFVHNYGLELRDDYPYLNRDSECPYGNQTLPWSMGRVRMNLEAGVAIPIPYFARYIRHGPINLAISTKNAFREYGGGVMDGTGCTAKGDHNVVLIGHGREDGREYWLIRNSYGVGWGERGHYKLAKDSNCIVDNFGFVYGTKDAINYFVEPNENPAHPKNRQYNDHHHHLANKADVKPKPKRPLDVFKFW